MIYVPDISFYQYRYKADGSVERGIDFPFMATKVPGVIIRAGQNTWKDKMFDTSWSQAKAAGLKRGSYWFYDPRIEPKRQAEAWAEVTKNDRGEMEFWADFERLLVGGMEAHGYDNPHQWYDFMEYCKQAMPGKKFGVYTGYYYWMERHLKEPMSYWTQYPLWIAYYGGTTPKLPKPWTEYVLWQFTDNGKGEEYGVPSGNIDLNYFNGKLTDFEARYGQSTQQENSNTMINYTMTPVNSDTRLRTYYSTSAAVITSFPRGVVLGGDEIWEATADGTEVRKGDIWLHVTHKDGVPVDVPGWTAHIHKGGVICNNFKAVDGGEPAPAPTPEPAEDVEVTVTVKDGMTTVFVNGEQWHK